jgi:phospholipase C
MRITRRDALRGLGVAVGTAALGCGGSPSTLGPGDSPDGAPPSPDGSPPDGRIDAGAPDAAPRELTPKELLADIDTFIVLCMENRSFDHYLGSLRLEGRTDIDGLTGDEFNLTAEGAPVRVHRLEDYTPADPPHSWDEIHRQLNDGACDGFVREHAGADQNDVMGYHTRDQLPITYALADQSAICQRWFCSVLGPTWPNRMYLHAGTSMGQRGNAPMIGAPTIWDRLRAARLTGNNFFHDLPWAVGGYIKLDNTPVEQFFERAEAGTLPNYSLIDPHFFGAGANDDHPSTDIRMGQALIASVVQAVAQSPQWKRSMIVITYDEHGGFYDHVAPPVCADEQPDFRRRGFRVPSLVIGPTVRRGAAIDTVLDHSSVISTLTTRFDLQPLTMRSMEAAPLSACIDPALVGRPQRPPTLPPMTISRSRVRSLRANPDAHPEMRAVADRMALPRGQDRRGESDAITQRMLAWGERLGAVRLVD